MAIQDQIAELMAKSRRLRKQEDLLRKRAGEFLVRDIKEIDELELLEKREEEERKRASDQSSSWEAASVAIHSIHSTEGPVGWTVDAKGKIRVEWIHEGYQWSGWA
ncbi:hypothetical protein V1509DRAFT_643777, partial [Lipomyces kononenkoae]